MSEPLMTFRISLPLPLPSEAPLISPGRSRICILAPLWSMMPGMQVRVVKAKLPASDSTSVSWEMRLDLPTLGKPTNATEASPDFLISKPWFPPLALEWAWAFSCFCLSAAIFAFNFPTCPCVALLYFVLEISSSMDLICSSIVAITKPLPKHLLLGWHGSHS